MQPAVLRIVVGCINGFPVTQLVPCYISLTDLVTHLDLVYWLYISQNGLIERALL